MNPALVQKKMKTNGGTEFTVGIRPYRSARVTQNYIAIAALAKEQGMEEDKINIAHGWLFYVMSYVGDIEFPEADDKAEGESPEPTIDYDLESLREYWSNANGNVPHNYELFLDVAEDIGKGMKNVIVKTIDEYKASFPAMPEVVTEGKPDDPNVSRAGGKQSKKKS